MAVNRDAITRNSVGAEKLTPSLRRRRFCHTEFWEEPHVYTATDDNGAPTGTTGNVNIAADELYKFEYVILGAGQTIVRPVLATGGGWDWGMDQTATEGVEINFGSQKEGHYRTFQVGKASAPEFYARLRFTVEDISGVDLYFGFRKVAAYQTAIATYTDVGLIRLLGDSSSAAAAVTTVTNLNDATDVTETATGSTVADGVDTEVEVRVVGRRAQFLLNGAQVGQANFQFDLDDWLTPIAFIAHTTDVAGQIKTFGFECGPLKDRPEGLLSAA
jgi:hypothetical protein